MYIVVRIIFAVIAVILAFMIAYMEYNGDGKNADDGNNDDDSGVFAPIDENLSDDDISKD
jgi:hypothetical protein